MEGSKKVRNPYPVPDLSYEGTFSRSNSKNFNKLTDRQWSSKLKPHERLFLHQTLNSARKNHAYILNLNVLTTL